MDDRDKVKEMIKLIKEADLSKTCILCGPVDPDGLASAWAMEKCIEKLGGNSTIFYKGNFNRPQNKVLKSLLEIRAKSEDEFAVDDNYTCVFAVDVSAKICPVKPDFVIDHHNAEDNFGTKGTDVRVVGSTSAIVLQYCQEFGISFEDEVGKKIITALLLGCITDTKYGTIETCTDIDYEAMTFCYKKKDTKLFKDIINFPKPHYYNDLFCKAWNNKVVEGTTLVSGVGSIPDSRVGVLSDLAEKFIEVEGISTAMVFCIVDNYIDISVRTNSKFDIDEYIKTSFGNGGGKSGAGRCRLELPGLFQNIPDDLSEDLYNTCFKIVKHKALQIAGDKK